MHDIDELLSSIQKQHKLSNQSKTLDFDDENLFWSPAEFVQTSFPEKKIEKGYWLKEYGNYSLNLQQLELDRAVPYGILAREIFEFFFNNFVKRLNSANSQPHIFHFNSTADFFNQVKGKRSSNKVSTDQRVLALEMLLNIESTSIRFKERMDETGVRAQNHIFIRTFKGPAHPKVLMKPSMITNGEIYIELDYQTYERLAGSKKVPTKTYLAKIAGSNVTARDLVIFISGQCYSLSKRNIPYKDFNYSDLKSILGKEDDISMQDFNRDLKRAVKHLQKNYSKMYPCEIFPADVHSHGRGKLVLRVYKPTEAQNILCA